MRPYLTVWRALAVASQIGFIIVVAVGLGVWAGVYLDSRFGTQPVFTLLGILAGIASGMISVVQLLKFVFRDRGTGVGA